MRLGVVLGVLAAVLSSCTLRPNAAERRSCSAPFELYYRGLFQGWGCRSFPDSWQAGVERGEPFRLNYYGAYVDDEIIRWSWRRVARSSEVRVIDQHRIRIDVSAAPFKSIRKAEHQLLARAAGETLRLGRQKFIIRDVDYMGVGLTSWLVPGVDLGYDTSIETYEELVRERRLQSQSVPTGRLAFRQISAVVQVLEDEAPSATAEKPFAARDVYANMLNELYFNGVFPY